MFNTFEKIQQLTRQLFPTGRAFYAPTGGVLDKLYKGLARGDERVFNDNKSILYTILPDNPNFTAADASIWEKRLGLIDGTGIDLELRKNAITRKINHPGTIPARQSADYLQDQLHAAGFTGVFVHENLTGMSIEGILTAATDDLAQLGDSQLADAQLGNPMSYYPDLFLPIFQLNDHQLGDAQLNNTGFKNKIVNYIDETKDELFNTGNNFRIFVIGGATLGTFGTVDNDRKDEFRQTVLRIKPSRTVGYLLVNYT